MPVQPVWERRAEPIDTLWTAEPPAFDQLAPRLPNLRHLRAAQLVGDLGSVNRAAEVLNLSQPAVTQAIARLEAQIAPDLFTRHPTGMYATAIGEIVLRRIGRAFQELDSALDQILVRTARLRADVMLKSVQLDSLAALVYASGLSEAAAKLSITPTAFKRNINMLEARLDLSLVFRDGNRIRLTRNGSVLARAARLVLRELEQVQEEIASNAGALTGRLVIGALPLVRSYIVPKAMITVGTAHPDVRLRLVESGYETLIEMLQSGDIDILVGTLREPAPVDGLIETPLFDDRLCVVGRADHPMAGRGDVTLDDVTAFPWIAPRLGSPARREFDLMMDRARHRPPQIFEVASHMGVRAILRESDSLALISRRQIRYEEREGQLTVLSDQMTTRPRMIGHTMRERSLPTRAMQEFLKALADAAQND